MASKSAVCSLFCVGAELDIRESRSGIFVSEAGSADSEGAVSEASLFSPSELVYCEIIPFTFEMASGFESNELSIEERSALVFALAFTSSI